MIVLDSQEKRFFKVVQSYRKGGASKARSEGRLKAAVRMLQKPPTPFSCGDMIDESAGAAATGGFENENG